MQLNPRYGDDPIIRLECPPAAVGEPTIRQRRRLAAALSSFTDEQWDHPSRCAGWSNRDVIVHLDSTNSFWAFSIAAGLGGEPTRFLATFDPVTSPAELVAGSADVSSTDVLDRFTASNDAFTAALESLGEADWSTLAEAPPGHVSISALAHHALWDSWVHERDILLPLGVTPDVEDDEIAACLRYAIALSPAFAISRGSTESGTLVLDTTGPDVALVAEISDHVVVRSGADGVEHPDLRLAGDAVELLEALSIRRPFDQAIPDGTAWMVSGLAETFDVAPA